MKTRKFIIPPGEPFEIAVQGDYVRVKQSAVDLLIENADAGESVEMSEGEDFDFSMFKTLRVSHEDASEQTVKLTISKGKRGGSAKVGGAVSVSNLGADQGAFSQGRASVTNVNQTIIAANAARRFLMIQNNDVSQTLRVTLSGVAATAAQGFRIGPGDSLDLSGYQSTAAVNAIMEAATGAADNVEFAEG